VAAANRALRVAVPRSEVRCWATSLLMEAEITPDRGRSSPSTPTCRPAATDVRPCPTYDLGESMQIGSAARLAEKELRR
jgi:hypothetical protein